MSESLQCYNKGCGKLYDPKENGPEVCVFHPGAPFFHDAYKGWSCCSKKFTDFTEFLNTKGCTKGEHSNIKPPEPKKPEIDKNNKVIEHTPILKPVERPSEKLPMIKLNRIISSSLKTALANLKPKCETEKKDASVITVGTACKNGGCKKVYESVDSNVETCLFHPGVPIFHEGMKYWSCCQRKTSDFGSFLSQEGCESGLHKWTKSPEMLAKETQCRYDWHQTGSQVVISIYAKAVSPDHSFVEANPVKLNVHLKFGAEYEVFDLQLALFGVIDVEKSKVNMMGSKVEINLKKANPMSWGKLALPEMKNLSLESNEKS